MVLIFYIYIFLNRENNHFKGLFFFFVACFNFTYKVDADCAYVTFCVRVVLELILKKIDTTLKLFFFNLHTLVSLLANKSNIFACF